MVTTRPPKTIVKPTALGPVANTDTKFLIYGLFQKGRVLAQDGLRLSILLWIDRLVCFAELAHDPVFDPLAAPPIDRCDSGTVQERREVQVIATR